MKTIKIARRTTFPVIIAIISILIIPSCRKDKEQQVRWDVINLYYTGDINDISVLPNDTIMLLSKLDKAFQKTCILESDDAGKTWSQTCFDKLETAGFSSFYSFNHLKIFAGNYRSYDGGNSWQKVGNFNGELMYFSNNNDGFGILGSSIYKTTNGGRSFDLVYNTAIPSGIGFQFFQFLNDQVGYASGGYRSIVYGGGVYSWGLIVKTTDGGNTWQPLPGKFKRIVGMSFVSADIGYIVISLDGGNVAELLKTTDGGDTWTTINDKIYDEFQIIPSQCYFADEQHGFLIGSGNVSKILSTSDGGKTWKEEYATTSSDLVLFKMVFSSSNTGYVIGTNNLLLKRALY